MRAAGRKLTRLGPEVGYPGNPAVLIEIEEAQPGVVVTGIGELNPARRVAALSDDPLHLEMPVAGEPFDVEAQVCGPPPNQVVGAGCGCWLWCRELNPKSRKTRS